MSKSKAAAAPQMTPQLDEALKAFRAERGFDAKAWIERKCKALNEYMSKCGLKTCITSVSGGVDSTVTIFLCMAASKMPGSPIQNVVGVCQPIHSSGWALQRGREVIRACGAKEVIVDQSALHDQLSALVEGATGIKGNDFARGQLRSYMRTPVGYFVAQLYSTTGAPAIVMGTGCKSEDGYLAYFCKAGDGVVDVQLISDLYKSEVYAVGAALGIPASVQEAAPSADLWAGQTDEEELGFSYDFLELFMGRKVEASDEAFAKFFATLDQASQDQFTAWGNKALGVHNRNKHKLAGIVNL